MIDPCGSGAEETCEFCSNYDSQAEALAAQELGFWTEYNKKFTPALGCGACDYAGCYEESEE